MSDLQKDLAEVVRLQKLSDEMEDPSIDENEDLASSYFLRRYHTEITRMAEDAEKWRLANSEYPFGKEGEIIKCHVNIGVNVWRGEDWVGFHECSIEELKQVLEADAASQDEEQDDAAK